MRRKMQNKIIKIIVFVMTIEDVICYGNRGDASRATSLL